MTECGGVGAAFTNFWRKVTECAEGTDRLEMLEMWNLMWSGVFLTMIPWSVLIIPLQMIGIRLYVSSDRDKCRRIQTRVYCSSQEKDNKPCGYILGRWYIGHITTDMESLSCWILATKGSYEFLTREIRTKEIAEYKEKKKVVTIYERAGSYTNIWYRKRTYEIETVPTAEQREVMSEIREEYRRTGYTTVYVHGPPGTGKSMLGIFLAEGGNYSNTVKPWQPGDTIGNIYSEVEPTKENPLIIVFEEIDGPLSEILTGILPHKNIPTMARTKEGWNSMLDEIGRGMYPHLILIMTSNKGPKSIQEESLLREGRISTVLEMKKKIKLKG